MKVAIGILLFVASLVGVVFASGNINSWQPFQPFKNNYLQRVGGEIIIDYGAPSGSGGDGSSSGVVFQVLLDETGSPIADEIEATSMASIDTNTYEVTIGEPYENLSPGITNIATFGGFFATGPITAYHMSTNDFVFEAWAEWTGVGSTNYIFDCQDGVSTFQGYSMFVNSSDQLLANLFADDDTQLQIFKNTSGVSDGNMVKIRISGDRSGSAELFVGGSSLGSSSLATVSGKNIECNDIAVGNRNQSQNQAWAETIFEVRITIGNATNDSGDGVTS